MTSVLDTLPSIDKAAIIIDIGQAYTKFGFAGSSSPRHIIPTIVTNHGETRSVFENSSNSIILHDDCLTEFIRSIFYGHNIINSRNRPVVIIESVVTPTRIRHLLAEILLKQLETLSLLFLPSHLAATYTLGQDTALVLDIGYREAQIMPVAEGVPLAMHFDSLSYASEAIHRQIQLLLEQHALIIQQGKKRPFNKDNLKLSERVLEDIKVRCCFISPFTRAQTFAQNKLSPNTTVSSFKEAPFVDYTFNSDLIIRIPGIVREFACEVLFEEDIDGRSIATLILDTLIESPIDLRRQLADNILVIGGTAMMSGFLHRLNAELTHLVNVTTYVNRLGIKQFHFHSPPAQLNYTAWLGGSIFGAIDVMNSQSITREKYQETGFLPDWFTPKQAV